VIALLYLALLAAAPAPDEAPIVVTASRLPVAAIQAPASVTVLGADDIEALGLPLILETLRLAPGLSVSSAGARGSQTQIRIRGAEANHTLLFVDGIKFNDPAAGNEARFELLAGDRFSRAEIVRGPQSALWGSEAIGGVIGLDSTDPLVDRGLALLSEGGGQDSWRANGEFALQSGELGISGGASWLGSEGIDSFGSSGERDGFENRSANFKVVARPSDSGEFGLVGHYSFGRSQFDGFDPLTFRRAATLDATRNRIGAVRAWGKGLLGGFTLSGEASWLGSANRNLLAGAPLNRTAGERLTASAQLSRLLGDHRVTAAVQHEAEDFRARDQNYFGATDQSRGRHLTAFIGEWRARWSNALSSDFAIRHDGFSTFGDTTTVRASATLKPIQKVIVRISYGEGIAQPTFFDLFGFFPRSFAGNPALAPESSQGVELSVAFERRGSRLAATLFQHDLEREILDIFDPATFVSSTANATGRSDRRGIELEARHIFCRALTLTANYSLLDAEEQTVSGAVHVREVRRPRHSGNMVARGALGPVNWGASLAWVGSRRDLDFDAFPARRVRLDDYVLASLRIGWALTEKLALEVRGENLFNLDYQDVFGYFTPGRTLHAALRLRFGS